MPLRSDTRWLSPEPEWLRKLQGPDGFTALEATLGYQIPHVVREFWNAPELVRLLDSFRWQDYLSCPPEIIYWENKANLVVCTHPHSGGVGAVLLNDTANPPLSWGFLDDDEPIEWRDVTMSQHVFASVQQGPDAHP